MSRSAKIIIFSLILTLSIYNKYVSGGVIYNFINNNSTTTKTQKKTNPKTTVRSQNINPSDESKKSIPPLSNPETRGFTDLKGKGYATEENNQFDIDSPDYTSIPKSGHSPYDSYFGKGIYHQTDNSIVVSAPPKTHVVFVVINTYTKKRIRNEFIRKGETFTMTKIPYGTYDYMYFTGRNWSNNVLINKGTVRGGFQDYKSFNKNDYNEDQMEFKRGYYGSYQITLSQTIGGNLETKSTSESAFFN